jgi:hypothetical protein
VAGGFYTDIVFHRIMGGKAGKPGFMVQVGDPAGTGEGGPGYYIDLEESKLPHDLGVLSMARTGEPNTGKVGGTDGRGDGDDRDKDRNKGKPKTFGAPGGPDQFKQGKRDDDGGGGGGARKRKDFDEGGGPGGGGGPKQFKQGGGQGGERAQGGDGGGDKKKDKCQKNPNHPSCQN